MQSLCIYVTKTVTVTEANNLPVLCLNWLLMHSGSNHVSWLPPKPTRVAFKAVGYLGGFLFSSSVTPTYPQFRSFPGISA